MTFGVGDRVHLAGLGTGVVREARSGERYLIDIKGRAVVASGAQLERVDQSRASRKARAETTEPAAAPSVGGSKMPPSIDLHGKSVAEAVEVVEAFINDALLAGCNEARVIHGRSGGRVKAAVHRYLRQLPTVASARVDPLNAGVTVVTFL